MIPQKSSRLVSAYVLLPALPNFLLIPTENLLSWKENSLLVGLFRIELNIQCPYERHQLTQSQTNLISEDVPKTFLAYLFMRDKYNPNVSWHMQCLASTERIELSTSSVTS